MPPAGTTELIKAPGRLKMLFALTVAVVVAAEFEKKKRLPAFVKLPARFKAPNAAL